jgi:hypothetical protein
MLFIALTLLIGAIRSVQTESIWDPYTGEKYVATSETSCVASAERLIHDSASIRDRVWSQGLSDWTQKCREKTPNVHKIMMAIDQRAPVESGSQKVKEH